MEKPEFLYVTYILTSPEKVWDALVSRYGVRPENMYCCAQGRNTRIQV